MKKKTNLKFALIAIKAVIVLTMLNNLHHAASLYHLSYEGSKIDSFWDLFSINGIQSFLVVAVIDLTLIILVSYGDGEKDARTASIFAWILFVVNLLIGNIIHDIVHFWTTIQSPELLTKFFGIVMFSALFSFTLHLLSNFHMRLVKQMHMKAEEDQELSTMEQTMTNLEAQVNQMESEAKHIVEKQEQLISILEQKDELAEQIKSLKSQLVEQTKKTEYHEARFKIDQINKTFYRLDGEELCESVKSLNGRMNNLSQFEKVHHYERKKIELAKYEPLIING